MVCAFSMGLSLLNLFAPGFAYRAHVTLAVAMLVIGPSIRLMLGRVDPVLGRASL
jgi:hypothetical protein